MKKSSIKPKKRTIDIVEEMASDRGITFKYISKKKAEEYLINVNNYFRTASYRKNYQKHYKGINKGKYINLDFMYLKELSIIDMHFRFLMMKMCSDIEHALKVYLIKNVEDNNKTDGYDIVEAFFHENGYIIPKIEAMSNAPFTADLVHKYFILEKNFDNKNYIKKYDTCPVWVLLELLSFGDFINFYKFYYHKNKQAHYPIGIINLIKSLRNAVAHNNCLLMNLSNKTTNPPALISNVVSKIRTIKSNQRKKRLSSRPILEFVCLLYMYNNIVSDKVKKHRIIELKHLFFVRMIEKKAFFQDNELLKSSYDFSYKIIRHFYGK